MSGISTTLNEVVWDYTVHGVEVAITFSAVPAALQRTHNSQVSLCLRFPLPNHSLTLTRPARAVLLSVLFFPAFIMLFSSVPISSSSSSSPPV